VNVNVKTDRIMPNGGHHLGEGTLRADEQWRTFVHGGDGGVTIGVKRNGEDVDIGVITHGHPEAGEVARCHARLDAFAACSQFGQGVPKAGDTLENRIIWRDKAMTDEIQRFIGIADALVDAIREFLRAELAKVRLEDFYQDHPPSATQRLIELLAAFEERFGTGVPAQSAVIPGQLALGIQDQP
jgi:hypothetical protein